MEVASSIELIGLEETVLSRSQKIADWLDTFPETVVSEKVWICYRRNTKTS